MQHKKENGALRPVPVCRREIIEKNMTRFVKVADEVNKTFGFINLDLVSMVQCSVEWRGGGSFDIGKMETVSTPKHLIAVITLSTANGIGKVVFNDIGEAEEWLQQELGIAVSFEQLA